MNRAASREGLDARDREHAVLPVEDRSRGRERQVSGCLYSQLVETRYGTFSLKMCSASSVRPPQVEL